MKKILLLLILVVVAAACSSSKGGNPAPTPTPTPTDPVEYDATGVIEGTNINEHVKVYHNNNLVDRIEVSVAGGSDFSFTYKIVYAGSEAVKIEATDDTGKGPYKDITDIVTINKILEAAKGKAFIEIILEPIYIEYDATGQIEGATVSEHVKVYHNNNLIDRIEVSVSSSTEEYTFTYQIEYSGSEASKIRVTRELEPYKSITDKTIINQILEAAESKAFIELINTEPIEPTLYATVSELLGKECIFRGVVYYDEGVIVQVVTDVAILDLDIIFGNTYNVIYEGNKPIKIEVLTDVQNLQYYNYITDKDVINRILTKAKNEEFIDPTNPVLYEATGMYEEQEIREIVSVYYNNGLIKIIDIKVLDSIEQYNYFIVYEGREAVKIEVITFNEKYNITDREVINRILLEAKNKEFIEILKEEPTYEYDKEGMFGGESYNEHVSVYSNDDLIVKIEALLSNEHDSLSFSFLVNYEEREPVIILQITRDVIVPIYEKVLIEKILNAAKNKEFIEPVLG